MTINPMFLDVIQDAKAAGFDTGEHDNARELMEKAAAHFDSLIQDIDNPYDNALHYCAEYLRALIPTEKEPS